MTLPQEASMREPKKIDRKLYVAINKVHRSNKAKLRDVVEGAKK